MSGPIYSGTSKKDNGFGLLIAMLLVLAVVIGFISLYLYFVREEERAAATQQEQVAPAATNGFEIVVVTEPRFTSEVPPPPVDSIAITNGEGQLLEIISRRKPKVDTNVVSPVR
jgi:Na+-transporting methylmalonyl-CoA/oxaloacetate decarboxylase gamma subunit